jgi:hypothetical protein
MGLGKLDKQVKFVFSAPEQVRLSAGPICRFCRRR